MRLFNLHLSDASADERLIQIEHLMALLRRSPIEGGIWNGAESDSAHWQTDRPPPMPGHAILLGDFNAEPGSAEHLAVTRGTVTTTSESRTTGYPFVDSWIAGGNPPERGVTYRRNPAQSAEWDQRIDYCFLPLDLVPRLIGTRIDQDAIGSDHQPVWVELRG